MISLNRYGVWISLHGSSMRGFSLIVMWKNPRDILERSEEQ